MGELERVNVTMPTSLKREARAKAIREGQTLSEVIRELLTLYVKGELPTKPRGKEADK